MKAGIASSLIIIALVYWFFTCPASVGSQEIQSGILSKQITAFDSTKVRMVDQLIELACAFEIPMGVEAIHNPKQQSSPEIHFRGSTVRDAIQDIVQQNPEYGWKVTRDIVHVFNRAITKDQKNYLNIRIPRYRIVNNSILGASGWLRISIDMYLHPQKYAAGFGGGMGYGIPQPPSWNEFDISLDVRDASVREILNEIVLANGNALWVSCIDPIQMMEGEAYFAQREYSSVNSEPKQDFYWDLIPMRKR